MSGDGALRPAGTGIGRLGRRRFLAMAALGAFGLAWPAAAQAPLEAGFRARDRWWARIGRSDPDLIAHLVNPQFSGGPAWPATRQAWRVVRTGASLIIASDGLSDPFDEGNEGTSGFGMEVYIETPDLKDAAFATLRDSWAFPLIENFAQNVANWGGIAGQLRTSGLLSIELPAPAGISRAWVTPRDTVGALINVPAPGRETAIADMPLGPVLIAPLTLTTPAETEHVIAGGGQARADLARRLAGAGVHQLSVIGRRSLV